MYVTETGYWNILLVKGSDKPNTVAEDGSLPCHIATFLSDEQACIRRKRNQTATLPDDGSDEDRSD